MITSGNTIVKMPYWNDLNGDDEVLGDGDKSLSTGKITAGADIAQVMYRGRGWSANEMAAVLSGSDPVRSMLSKIGAYWDRAEQRIAIATLNGLFADGGALKDHINKTGAGIDAAAILDTKQLMGDHANGLALLEMNSAVYTDLQKQELIVYIQPANTDVRIPTYLGYRVVVDDGIKANADGSYTTYLLGQGAFGRNTGTPTNLTTFETDRDKAAGTDKIFTRRAFVLHPYGVAWTGANVDEGNLTASNIDLAKADNWNAVYDLKNISIVALNHTIGKTIDNSGAAKN
jgi:hypothetical protein